MTCPLLSVIIPVWNGEPFLAGAVASVVNQGWPALEILIVDDGSTDRTRDVAAALQAPIRCLAQSNAGPAAARNRGLAEARGDLIAFLDVDDLWSPDKTAIQAALLARDPAAGIAQGYTQVVRCSTAPDGTWHDEPCLAPYLAHSLGAALVRAAVFRRVGLLDEGQRYCDDVDWFLRAAECGIRKVVHRDVVQLYRRHGQNLTRRRDLDRHYLLRALKRSLDRRRCNRIHSLPQVSDRP